MIEEKNKQKLNNMYIGDKARDARSKIRGFLFQDLVAISFLLDVDTEYVCTEFLEDIGVFQKNNTVKFFQVKYYPETALNKKEVFTDLYCQYLRIKFLQYNGIFKVGIVIATDNEVELWDASEMKIAISSYVDDELGTELILSEDDSKKWLIENVYPYKKEEQKKILIKNISSETKIEDFLSIIKIDKKKPDIEDYKTKLKDRFDSVFCLNPIENNERAKDIILGLSIMKLQEKYSENCNTIDDVLISREEYLEYINNTLLVCSDLHIQAYLVAMMIEIYSELLEDIREYIDIENLEKLEVIADGTSKYICNLAKTVEGQYSIINTMSFKRSIDKSFLGKTVEQRYKDFVECRENFKTYLKTLWKIILNLNKDNHKNEVGLFDIKKLQLYTYVDSSVKEYISVNFLQFKQEILLPSIAADPSCNLVAILNRMKNTENKPNQYYMRGGYRGKYDYSQKVTEVIKHNRVSNPYRNDTYNIECMKCISVDMFDWNHLECCNDCIFDDKCSEEP